MVALLNYIIPTTSTVCWKEIVILLAKAVIVVVFVVLKEKGSSKTITSI